MRISKRYILIIWVVLTISVLGMVYMLMFYPEAMVILKIASITCFLLAALVLIYHYKAQALYNYIKTKYKDAYKSMAEYLVLTFTTWADRLKVKALERKELDLLTPTIKKTKYVEILKSAINKKGVRNIAITGPYGSGKSTVIKTFQYLYPKYKCLCLSLASFAEEQNTKDAQTQSVVVIETSSDGQTKQTTQSTTKQAQESNAKPTVDVQELEYSLVQQLFYHVKASEIPDSRYGRIRRISRLAKSAWAVSILLSLFAVIILVSPDFFKTITGEAPNALYKYISFGVASLLVLRVIYQVVGVFHKLNTARLSVMGYEVSVEKNMNVSIFNKYLDELIYLFMTTKYEVVFLEDLDRFDNTSIFTKLRELNLLLNHSKDIKRRIVFVYALKDEIFVSSQERTKFFDYIISLTPHVNYYSAASHFVEKLEEFVEDESDIHALHKQTLADMAPFATDLRTIKSIVSDFKVTKEILDESLKLDNLLAMVVYKNVYPKEYSKIHYGKGHIVDTFNSRGLLIEKRRHELEGSIKELEEEIKQIESEELQSITELKSIVVSAFFKLVPTNYAIYDPKIPNIAI